MVLERLVSIKEAVRRPWWMFIIGGAVSISCLFISFLIFPEQVGLFTTILITFAMTPFMINLNRYEEAKEEQLIARRKESSLLSTHRTILLVYTAFFAGTIFSLSIAFLILPGTVVEKLFNSQINEINLIRGNVIFGGTFDRIILNNVGVLAISFLFSVIFGAGATFILSWNASVLSTAIGLAAKSIGGLRGLPLALLVYFPHGSLEILAYFIGGVAGGLISAAFTRRKPKWLWFVVKDSLILMGVAIVVLLVAAGIETVSIVMS